MYLNGIKKEVVYYAEISTYMEETTIKTQVTGTTNELRITDMYGKQVLKKLLDQGYMK